MERAGASGRLAAGPAFGLAMLTLTGSIVAIVVPVLGLPTAAGSLAALIYGGRALLAFSVIGVGALAAGTLDPTAFVELFVVTAGSLLAVGPLAARLMRDHPMFRTSLVTGSVLVALQFGVLAWLATRSGVGVQEYVMSIVDVLFAGGFAIAEADVFREQFGRLWPGTLLVVNGLTAVISAAAVSLAATRSGVPVRPVTPIGKVDLDARAAVLPIAAAALLAVDRFTAGAVSALGVLGDNAVLVSRWLFFVQGIAVFGGLYERARMGRIARSLGYLLLGMTEVLLPVVSLTGLVDVWVNFRKLPRDGGKPGSAVEAPGATD